MTAVRVEMRKYDGSAHRGLPTRLLGRDHHGTWLGIPSGTVADSGKVWEIPGVLLVPHVGWWTAIFNAAPRNTSVYCDITTPAQWTGNSVVITDLDLDVRKIRETGEVQLVDEDEFSDHADRFHYPEEVVRQARAAAAWLLDALRNEVEPFAGHFHRWLALFHYTGRGTEG
jgi:protein associated with RNAse G/E